MARKRILILHSGSTTRPDVPENLESVYETFSQLGKKDGFQILRSSISSFEGGRFKKVWLYKNGWHLLRNVRPDVVYDKTRLYEKHTGKFSLQTYTARNEIFKVIPMYNDPMFSRLLANKLFQTMIFYKDMPDSILRRPNEVIKNPGKKLRVFKSLYGSGGRFVEILKARKIRLSDFALEQAFVAATRNGRLMDTRIVFINNTPQYAFRQIAQSGSLYTNTLQGAKREFIPLSKVTKLVSLSKKIAEPLHVFPKRIFSLDYLLDAQTGRPYLIEANSMPVIGFLEPQAMKKFLRNLAHMLLTAEGR